MSDNRSNKVGKGNDPKISLKGKASKGASLRNEVQEDDNKSGPASEASLAHEDVTKETKQEMLDEHLVGQNEPPTPPIVNDGDVEMAPADGTKEGETEGVLAKSVSNPVAEKGESTPQSVNESEAAKDATVDASASSVQEAGTAETTADAEVNTDGNGQNPDLIERIARLLPNLWGVP